MEQDSPQISGSDEQVTTVSTNNFRNVLENFDEDGHIKDQRTRFDITCSICYEKNLALLNPVFDKRSRKTHESYAVLPMCGHAFGYTCLLRWLKLNFSPSCPICRKQVFRNNIKNNGALSIFGDSGVDEQHEEIVDIRQSLVEDDLPARQSDRPRYPHFFLLDGLHEMERRRTDQVELAVARAQARVVSWSGVTRTDPNPAGQLD
ncbi:hypothetical protein F5Y05DRAFT_414294 [Hypoxylon sp. FL0543]|nr:hypothetical protein F5Y05DRAFT_414294 [Hypoxylon sp. FL0543]